jgi:hypothetical protein
VGRWTILSFTRVGSRASATAVCFTRMPCLLALAANRQMRWP